MTKIPPVLPYAKVQYSPNQGGPLADPKYLVLHYTAGASLASSVSWLCNPQAKASAHVVIGRDGSVVQLVAFDKVAWACGVSEWKGVKGLNGCSVSIELDNCGPLKASGGVYRSVSTGIIVEPENVYTGKHANGGTFNFWETYTPEQLETCKRVCYDVKTICPSIVEIVGHDDIAPGRKWDPGPGLSAFKAEIKFELGL
jgi:N-acetylmuramoyl-L-alanine amidase